MSQNAPHAVPRVALRAFSTPQTLDKMMPDRKHLTAGEVEKLLAATKGTRNEDRDR
jgi:hypothetical protein